MTTSAPDFAPIAEAIGLSEGISTVEGWTETPRIVRIIILGEHGS